MHKKSKRNRYSEVASCNLCALYLARTTKDLLQQQARSKARVTTGLHGADWQPQASGSRAYLGSCLRVSTIFLPVATAWKVSLLSRYPCVVTRCLSRPPGVSQTNSALVGRNELSPRTALTHVCCLALDALCALWMPVRHCGLPGSHGCPVQQERRAGAPAS